MLLKICLFTKMKEYIGIILIAMSALMPGDCGNCGTLTFDKRIYNVGSCASLIYKPENSNADRVWYKEHNGLAKLNIESTSKYYESNQRGQFTLTISEIEKADAGYYIVSCDSSTGIYTDHAFLHVSTSSDAFHCGQLEFELSNVYKGEFASLIYKPDCAMASVEWYKTDYQSRVRLHPNRTSESSTKYTELKTDEGYILIINETEFADDGNYIVSCGNGKFSRYAKLNVKVDPESIDIKSQPTKENETSNVECTAINGRPPSKPVFYFKNNPQSTVNVTKRTQSGYTITLWKKLTRQDNQASVWCCSESYPDVCSNTEYLNVTFPPKYVVLSELSKESKENGHTVLELKCEVDASNPKSFIDWKGVKDLPRKRLEEKYTNHTATHGWTYTTTFMFNLTKEDKRREITCHVKNFEFPDLKLQQSYTPNITYSPVITISENGNKTVYIGDNVLISCHVDSNPPSQISWSSQNLKMKELNGKNKLELHLDNVTAMHSQTYTCKASNGIGGTKSRDITLSVKEKTYNQPSSETKDDSFVGPIIGCTVVTVTAIVAVVIVLLILWKKRNQVASKRTETHQTKDETRNERVHPSGNESLHQDIPAPNENEMEKAPEYACVIPKARRKDSTDQENNEEAPEYAGVIPKSKRMHGTDQLKSEDSSEYACVIPKAERKVGTDQGKSEDTRNQGDKLVYAELDLNFDSENTARRALTKQYEPTEYTTIDLSKTGTVTIDKGEMKTVAVKIEHEQIATGSVKEEDKDI